MTEPTLKATLSPSRISDFNGCPLRFRYRSIDRIPERPGPEAFRGTVVHKVLEEIFDLPRHERTEERAIAALREAFDRMFEAEPNARFAVDGELAWPDDQREPSTDSVRRFLDALPAFISRYFVVEQPDRFDAAHRELYLKGQIDDDLWLHGFVDRIDISPAGDVRIVDYKTGKAPGPNYQDKALFQLKCYALLWQHEHDTPVRRLMMLFLGSGERLVHDPRPLEVKRVQDSVRAVWANMKRANDSGTWEAKPSKLCDWCAFQTRCPSKSAHVPRFEPVPLEFPR